MKTLLSLIVLTTLVAQLPQLQAAPSGINLHAILQSYLERLINNRELSHEGTSIQNKIEFKNCPTSGSYAVPLLYLNQLLEKFVSEQDVNIEIKCSDPDSSTTSIIEIHSGKRVELHYKPGLCRRGDDKIRIGPGCKKTLIGIAELIFPVGTTGKTMKGNALLSYSSDGQIDCIAIENFSGPECSTQL